MSEPIKEIKVVLIRQLIRGKLSNEKIGKQVGVSTSRVQREREKMRQLSSSTKEAAGAAFGFAP